MNFLRTIAISAITTLLSFSVTAQDADSLRRSTINAAKYLKSVYEIDEAIDTLSTLVTNIFDEEVFAELADCHFQNGDFEGAEGAYYLLSGQNPRNMLYRVRRTVALYRMKAYDRAVIAGKALLQLDSIPAIVSLVGDAYNQMEKYDSALVYYNRALAIKPFNESVVSKAAKILLDSKDYPSAVALTNSFLELSPDNFAIAPIKGLALYMIGEYEPAINVFESQLKLGNRSYGIHYHLGQCYWQTKVMYRAEQELLNAWQIDSSDVNLAFSIAAVKADAYKPFDTNVKPWLDKALEMFEPDHSILFRIHQQYGLGYYKEQKAWDKAIKHYKEAYKYNPSFISALSTIGYCYDLKKDYKSALNWYEKYIAAAKPGSRGYEFVSDRIVYVKGELFMETP